MANSDAAALKGELNKLIDERKAIENEIAERLDRLNAPGMPGMDKPLVDSEGYPRGDIDLFAVRTDRNRVICLSNDHKALTKQIDDALTRLHELYRSQGVQRPAQPYSEASGAAVQVPPSLPSSSSSAAAVPVEVAASTSSGAAAGGGRPLPKPFAIIDAVSQYSPAAEAGIQIGDQLCQFGDQLPAPDASGATLLQQVAATVQVAHEQGAAVQTVLLRHGAPVTLSLTPRRWAGQGLLGCHLRPFPL